MTATTADPTAADLTATDAAIAPATTTTTTTTATTGTAARTPVPASGPAPVPAPASGAAGGAAGGAAADKTGARTARAAEVITDARHRIDALDDRIIGLIQERMAVSAVIQEARITSGGRRVNLSREMEVLGRYRDALGKPGTGLGMTLLELCRGRI